MNSLLWILLATGSVSIISFVGVLALFLKEKRLEKILMFLVALSAGALMGGAFLHLIPEALEGLASQRLFICVLAGFSLFFFVEKILHWRHCHLENCPQHSFTYMILFGDGLHNFIDGLIIAASFVADIRLGFVTTLAVTLHEIPQEFGDFGVLVYGGFGKLKALMVNFICALTAVLGGLAGYFLASYIEGITGFLLAFAAGGFIYIAASDLIPEIRKEAVVLRKALMNFGIFILGILIIYGMRRVG